MSTEKGLLYMQFYHILILKNVIAFDFLSLIFIFAPDTGEFEFAGKVLVYGSGHIQYRGSASEGEGIFVVNLFARGFAVNPDNIQHFKQSFSQYGQTFAGKG